MKINGEIFADGIDLTHACNQSVDNLPSPRPLGAVPSFTMGTELGLEHSTILAKHGKKGLRSFWEQPHNRCMSPDRRAENTTGLGTGSCIVDLFIYKYTCK